MENEWLWCWERQGLGETNTRLLFMAKGGTSAKISFLDAYLLLLFYSLSEVQQTAAACIEVCNLIGRGGNLCQNFVFGLSPFALLLYFCSRATDSSSSKLRCNSSSDDDIQQIDAPTHYAMPHVASKIGKSPDVKGRSVDNMEPRVLARRNKCIGVYIAQMIKGEPEEEVGDDDDEG